MFQKPFKIRAQTAIKGSDRKKLRTQIGKQYGDLSDDQLKLLVPNKEDMTVMKLTTHSGDNIVAYCLQRNPVFFEVHDQLFPTVYSLWNFPELLPVFTTWPPVFSKLTAGADLMLPGVAVDRPVTPTTFSHLDKGQVCAVKLLGNKAPVAVGRTALSGSDMYESGMRGKGVLTVHTYKDLLWAHGDKNEPPFIDDNEWVAMVTKREDGDLGEEEENETEQNGENKDEGEKNETETEINVSENDGPQATDSALPQTDSEIFCVVDGVKDIDIEGEESEKDRENNIEREVEGAAGGTEDEPEEQGLPPQEHQDKLLYQCFLCAIKSSVKKSDLPLLTSAFFKNHMLPFCPSGETIDVKKSSYKKLGKFLHSMQQKEFIKVKELSKGADSIVEVHKDHAELRGFTVPERTRPEESTSKNSEFVPPQITEMYTITAATLPFFKEVSPESGKGDALTVTEIRKYIHEYVKSKELQNKSQVQIDYLLSPLVLQKDEYKESLRWDDLLIRFLNKMSPACKFEVPGQEVVIKKGRLEPVTLKIATRAGNKKVTLIHNLETYGIDLQEFAHTIQKAVACSTSISPLPGKSQGMEVLVQGNQINYIAQLLTEKYQLPKKYIQGLELAPKSGKKKR